MLHRAIDAIHRQEGGRILAGLIRRYQDFGGAEDALQEAYLRALREWPEKGLPANPAAWLTTVAQRVLVDRLRRTAHIHPESDLILEDLAVPPAEDSQQIADDQLRLIFTCCHPALAQSSQAALALKTLCRLSTAEIARAFVEPEATTAQKIVRAKRKIAAARIPYAVPEPSQLPDRLAAALAVIYLVFNEGYSATQHDRLLRPDLCTEAIRLGRLLAQLMPTEPEPMGLLAMMLLHDARRDAREAEDGVLIPLEEQDRRRWKHDQIKAGTALLDQAMHSRKPGPYQIQAAIASLHCQPTKSSDTDWKQIAALYGALLRHVDTPVTRLNAAVAIAMASGPADGLRAMQHMDMDERLTNYHLFHASRADLLRRLGQIPEAIAAYQRALVLTRNSGERRFLERRLNELDGLAP
jgi:RNA polymerase sigma-70 factor (ECF subfamily)